MIRTKKPYDILEKAYERIITELLNKTDMPDDLFDLQLTYRSHSGVTITFSWRDNQDRLEHYGDGGL